jgi:hypothetical protein
MPEQQAIPDRLVRDCLLPIGVSPEDSRVMATTTSIVPTTLASLTPDAHPTRGQVVEALSAIVARTGNGGFAGKMLDLVSGNIVLSPRQRECVIDMTHKEAARLARAATEAQAARLDASGIVAMFARAVERGAERVSISLNTGGGIRFGRGRNGTIYVSDAADFGNRVTYGRIAVGSTEIALRDDVAPEVALAVAAVAADPVAAIVQHGHLTGKCSFCSRPLTDGGSISHGYGAICAEKYGLPWRSESNRALRKQVAAEVAAEVAGEAESPAA